ncbi:MAG: phenylphosphate carboxylase subunit gamma [Desulfobacterales bacterium]|nr:phenylphosphate carboxylase subunit gamma [Desulfobacterales bacterium]
MSKKEYLAWVDSLDRLPENKEIQLTIRDLTPGRHKYEARNVKAILSRDSEKWPDGDILRFRSPVGILLSEAWAIKITAQLQEYLPGTPYKEVLAL